MSQGKEWLHQKWQDQALDQELTRRMRPVAPPPDFVDRVMIRVSPHEVQRLSPGRTALRRWAAGVLAASLLVGAGFRAERQHRFRQQQRAEQQFETAMHITARALSETSQQLTRSGFAQNNSTTTNGRSR